MRFLLASALLLGLCYACAPAAPALHEEIRSLLEGSWERDADLGSPELITRLVSPVPEAAATDERRAALIGAPPQRVRFEVRRSSEAQLTLATALDESAAACSGEVLFRVSWNGAVAFEETHRTTDAAGWREHSLDISSGGVLELETLWSGTGTPALAAVGGLKVQTSAPTRPAPESAANIVLIVIDTLRADALGTYGGADNPTPNIDALAAGGTVFTRVQAPTPWTSPSTASLLTGLSPPEHGLGFDQAQYLPDDLRTLAEVLRAGGYECGGFSANPLISKTLNFHQGFDVFEEFPWAHADTVVGAALKWWQTERTAPAFLYLHITDPHDPYEPDPDLRAEFAVDAVVDWATETRGLRRRMFTEEAGHFTELEAKLSQLYRAEVRGVDRSLRPLFVAAGASTLLALTADHGEEFLDHGLFGHGHQLHDSTTHVPLIIRGPGVAAGRREERRELVSVAGTLLELAGVVDGGFAGARDLFEPGETAVRFSTRRGYMQREAGWEFVGPTYGVIAGGWRLHWAPAFRERSEERLELFDLDRDPLAQKSLAQTEVETARVLRAIARDWLQAADPVRLPTGQEELKLLREIGYLSDEEDDR